MGVDLHDFSETYPGAFVQADVLTWEGWRDLRPSFITASPPCEEFTRYSLPWTAKKNPPLPNLDIWARCEEIARVLEVRIVIENVRFASRWKGRSKGNCGAFHLWGDVPALVPYFSGRFKESMGSKERAKRAEIPLHLARWIADYATAQVR